MSDKKGLIYLITSPTGKHYVGQHNSNKLEKRKLGHINNYFNFLKEKCILELNKKFNTDMKFRANPKGFCTSLCGAFLKYGYRNFTWKVLERNILIEDLNSKEDSYIEQYCSLSPNGYNLKLNNTQGGKPAYSDESRKLMSESSIKKVRDNLHNYRRNQQELDGIPQNVTC